MKSLIINADDFGFTRDVNAGIVLAHREGVLTSATLMANGGAFEHAVELAQDNPRLGVGTHLVLVKGRSLLTGELLPASPRHLLTALATRSLDVYAELRLQIEKMARAGLTPTHLDTHKHTHLVPAVFRAVVRLAREFHIPYVRLPLDRTVRFLGLRPTLAGKFYRSMAREQGVKVTDHFLGFHLTGSLTEESFALALSQLQDGLTEFMCHPGLLGEELAAAPTRLKESRARELEALVSPRIRNILNDGEVHLREF